MSAILSATSGCDDGTNVAWTTVSVPPLCIVPPIINSPAACSTTVDSLACAGPYVFQFCKTATGCAPVCDNVTVNNFNYPAGNVANAGPDQRRIATLVATMAAYPFTVPNTGIWTKISGPGTVVFASNTNAATGITVSLPGTYVLRWTIVQAPGSPCPPLFDEVTVTFA